MSRDRRLAEMMGLCWHEMDRNPLNPHLMCAKCQKMWRDIPDNPDFSTPEWRAKLMDWATGQERFKEFVYWTQDRVEKIELAAIYVYLWRNLPSLLVEYHGEGGNE